MAAPPLLWKGNSHYTPRRRLRPRFAFQRPVRVRCHEPGLPGVSELVVSSTRQTEELVPAHNYPRRNLFLDTDSKCPSKRYGIGYNVDRVDS